MNTKGEKQTEALGIDLKNINLSMADLYKDIRNGLDKYLGFLKDAGFSDFAEEQIAYEYHFITHNDIVSIDIRFEMILSTPIWVAINGYYIEHLEPANEVFKNYPARLAACYESQDKLQYEKIGKGINDDILKEVSAVVQRHPDVLKGDLTILQANTELYLQERANKAAEERINKGIYTVEFAVFSNDDYHAYEEFENLDAVRAFVAAFEPGKLYRVLDPHMLEVKLT